LIRTVLTDAQWQHIAPLLPGKKGDPGRSGDGQSPISGGILWIVRTGAPWRDLPDVFGNWFTVWKRFRRWALKGVFEKGPLAATVNARHGVHTDHADLAC
jgi:transposase